MNKILEIFSTRELALFTWIVVLALLSIVSRKMRPSIIHLLKSFLNPMLLGIQLVTWCYIALIVYAFYSIDLWNWSMLKDTLIWMLFTSFLMIMQMATSKKKKHLKHVLFDSFKVIIIFEFVVNMYTFGYFVELILMLFLSIIVMLVVVAEQNPQNQIVVNFFNWLLAIFGGYVLYYSIKQIWIHFDGISWSQTALDFILPIWLTVLFIPFMFVLKWYMKWEKDRKWNKYINSN